MTEIVAFSMSHNFTVLSSEHDKSILWSGEILHYLTQFVWPTNDCLNFPYEVHILIVLSEEQLIKKSYYFDKESFNMEPEWALTALFLPFLYYKFCLHCIFPNSNFSIFSTWVYSCSLSIKKNIINRTLVAYKLKWSYLWFKAPNLYKPICSSWYYLFPMMNH